VPSRFARIIPITLIPAAVVAVAAVLLAAPAGATPGNDDFASAADITTLPFNDTVNTTGATTESGEPTPSCIGGAALGATVWYEFTVPGAVDRSLAAGDFRTTTGSEYDATIAVYAQTGAGFGGLSQVACGYLAGAFNGELAG